MLTVRICEIDTMYLDAAHMKTLAIFKRDPRSVQIMDHKKFLPYISINVVPQIKGCGLYVPCSMTTFDPLRIIFLKFSLLAALHFERSFAP
jgi:hypothetical protein